MFLENHLNGRKKTSENLSKKFFKKYLKAKERIMEIQIFHHAKI
jgi:hypothetical protein